jgi:hypothetical protein
MKKIIVSFVVLMSLFVLASCGTSTFASTRAPAPHPATTMVPGTPTTQPALPDVKSTAAVPSVPAAAASSVPFKVVGIDMAVNPTAIASMVCGQSISVIYTATFHVAANSPGGTVQFVYTVNNGRSTTPAHLNFAPGQTIKTYAFTWQGTLSADNVYPGLGGVLTSSPNVVHSPSVKPTGTCAASTAFKVTSIDLAVSPPSIAGMSCNSSVTFTYTVTFHVAPNSPGGTIQFMYTTTNGRSSVNGSVAASAGATTVTYTFTSSGVLSPDHTFPGIAEVISTSPNQLNSSQVTPAGQCS